MPTVGRDPEKPFSTARRTMRNDAAPSATCLRHTKRGEHGLRVNMGIYEATWRRLLRTENDEVLARRMGESRQIRQDIGSGASDGSAL